MYICVYIYIYIYIYTHTHTQQTKQTSNNEPQIPWSPRRRAAMSSLTIEMGLRRRRGNSPTMPARPTQRASRPAGVEEGSSFWFERWIAGLSNM